MLSTTGPPPVQTAKESQLLQAIKDNFVLVSGAAVIIGTGLATIFLAAYLSVFDWHLLWFVQYTDILTFGLIAIGVISGSILFLQASVQAIISLFKLSAPSRKRWLVGLCITVLGIVAFNVWGSVRQGEGSLHILFGTLVIALGLIVILQIIGYAAGGILPGATQSAYLLILLVMSAVYCGQWLGYSVLESGKLLDVKIKDGTISGVKLIIVMARHTILLKDGETVVVPTSDIGEFRTTSK